MAQIIVEMPDEEVKNLESVYDMGELGKLRTTDYSFKHTLALTKAILKGRILPKGHGRLIDADALQRTYCEDNCGARKCTDAMDRCVFIGAVLEAPTIIEADKEGTAYEHERG